jgi:hypothetical protein
VLNGEQVPAIQQPASFSSVNEALENFRDNRGAFVKYVKTTTDDLHKYKLKTASGDFDIYSLMALSARHTAHYANLREEIRKDPHFPR